MKTPLVHVEEKVNLSFSRRVLKILRLIDKWVFEGIEKFVVASGLLILSVVVCAIVFTRYLFNYSPDWSDELPRFLLIWVTFVGMSYCVRKGEHVIIDVLFNKFGIKLKKYLYMIIVAVCFLFFVYMTYIGYLMTVRFFAGNQVSVTLGISMGYVYLAVPVGCFLAAKNFLHIFIKNLFTPKIYLDLDDRREN